MSLDLIRITIRSTLSSIGSGSGSSCIAALLRSAAVCCTHKLELLDWPSVLKVNNCNRALKSVTRTASAWRGHSYVLDGWLEKERCPVTRCSVSATAAMSVLLETSVGDIVIDLATDRAPRTCDNFLKLCAVKYFNDCSFHTVRRDHSVQTGDPTNTGTGGQSIHALLAAAAATASSPASRFLADELDPSLTHARAGTVGMSNMGLPNTAASQFYITTAPGLHALDHSHTVFGHVAEGMDAVERINAAVTDERGRPTVHIRIRHVAVLDDPFPMPDGLAALIPPHSPPAVVDPYDFESIHAAHTDADDSAAAEASPAVNPHAVVLEMIGDLPSADVAPPDNVLFVCRLNPVTRDDELQLLFARFGAIRDCTVGQR